MRTTFSLALAAVGAALIAVLAQFTLPLGTVPLTLQNFAIGLVATIFHRREAVWAVGLYLLLGAIGLPVFAGGAAGFHVLTGPTAGYLWFDLAYAAVTSSLTKPNSKLYQIFLANLLGATLTFLGGVLGLVFLTSGATSLAQAFTVGVVPFILPDLLKIVLICLVSLPIFRALKNHSYFSSSKV
ncbi:biotin transporter BioY [Streptococcus oricebi]|uniref:Biotin transporter n=1 Tax=Streptococcus oricebi TaxID=1547447 RepID=A0ABS5B287_9STRE|nr:biotin transporter BioY [Streptococcus oricebi]MBP2622944.1 BioY family transporter [Streptococcus oricebi]